MVCLLRTACQCYLPVLCLQYFIASMPTASLPVATRYSPSSNWGPAFATPDNYNSSSSVTAKSGPQFELGEYRVATGRDAASVLAACTGIRFQLRNIALISASAAGSSLVEYASQAINSPYYRELSNEINLCSRDKKFNESEVYYHAALAVWPWNSLSLKNMAYHLELHHFLETATSLYEQGLHTLPGDVGMLIQQAFMSPHFLQDSDEGLYWHIKTLARVHRILSLPDNTAVGIDPTVSIRDIQVGAQYTGYCPGIIYEAYSRCMLKLFPPLAHNNLLQPIPGRDHGAAAHRGDPRENTITVGIVSEATGNSSPGLCLQEIFQQMVMTSQWPIDLVFFSRPKINTVFASVMEGISKATYVLDENNIDQSVHIIRDLAQPDILFYLALPTERFTVALAHYRLAPVQIQYGIGHPLSSGVVNSIDYSIVSSRMLVTESDLRTVGERIGQNGADMVEICSKGAAACIERGFPQSVNISRCRDVLPPACYAYGQKGMHYTEQVVLLDSLGFHIQDFSLLYFTSADDVLRLRDGSHCNDVDVFLHSLSIPVSAEDLGCRGDRPAVHLYSCIQHSKKMHPAFDEALLGILRLDSKAKLLLNSEAKRMMIKRWQDKWEMSIIEINERVIFTPRIEHWDYLRLLSYSTVFLNPFPFGSGITSSDAISVCIPVVVFPEHISVLPFALAQVRALDSAYENLFVTHSVQEYIERAVSLAISAHTEQGRALRRDMCLHKHRLFSRSAAKDAAAELANFFLNASRTAALTT